MIAAEGVADEDGVVAGGVERAVGFVAEGETDEFLAVLKREGARAHEILGRDESDVVGREVGRRGRGGGGGLGFVGHAWGKLRRNSGARQGRGGDMTRRARAANQGASSLEKTCWTSSRASKDSWSSARSVARWPVGAATVVVGM